MKGLHSVHKRVNGNTHSVKISCTLTKGLSKTSATHTHMNYYCRRSLYVWPPT